MGTDGNQLDHRDQIADLLAAQSHADQLTDMGHRLERLCRAAAQHFQAIGSAICLMSDEDTGGLVSGADETSAQLEELQFILGEGPSRIAFANRRPQLMRSSASPERDDWPVYRSAIWELGVRGVFAFPLYVGAATFGVFTIYMGDNRPPGEEDLSMALAFAEIAIEMFLDAETVPFHGVLHPGVESMLTHRVEVYQAQGFVMVELDVTLEEALILMREYAFGHGQSLVAVSRHILSGEITLTRQGDPP